jgi:hypothetical protein
VEHKMRAIAPNHNQIRCEVVTTYEQMLHAYAIRSICFMEEHGVKAQQTFDGNDYQSTHMIVYARDEPVGTLRIRWFKDFAKLERTAFRKSHRGIPNIKILLNFAFAHIARKGYPVAITHAAPIYARLWRMHFGFRDVPGKPPVEYHGEKYFELMRPLDVPSNAIALDSDAAVLFRTEGEWDMPAKYEVR